MGSNSHKYTCIDLFAGAGGLSTGLEMAGFNPLYAVELSETYARSLAQSHPNTEIAVGDIREVDARSVRRALGLAKGELTILAGGPPCQGFSVNAPVRSEDDHRNHLFLDYLRFVEEFSPRVVLIENVPGMVSFAEGKTIREILKSLRALGYNAAVKVLFAAHYGVPQTRWRTIFLATKDKVDASSLFPIPSCYATGRANFRTILDGQPLTYDEDYIQLNANSSFTTVEEAIGDLPEIPNGGRYEGGYQSQPRSLYQSMLRSHSQELYNHQCSGIGKANLERIQFIPQGGSWRDIPHDILPKGMKRARRSDHTKRYGRLHPESMASTILTKCDPHWGTFFHPNQDRVISVREAARLQSFPDSVVFVGKLSEQYEQVGNAVPPLFAKAIGEQVISVINQLDDKGHLSREVLGVTPICQLALV